MTVVLGAPGPAFDELVEEAYKRHGGNVSAIEKELREQRDVKSSRRRIAGVIDRFGFGRVKKPRAPYRPKKRGKS